MVTQYLIEITMLFYISKVEPTVRTNFCKFD